MLAHQLGCRFIPVRKAGKLPYKTASADYELEYGTASVEMHIDAIDEGMRVLIHDDLLATCGTAHAAAKLIQTLHGEVIGFSFLIALSALPGETFSEEQIWRRRAPYRPILTNEDHRCFTPMPNLIHVPMFPLQILPLPGELVPLHIFEPRYRQLLEDAESDGIKFGIYFSHDQNEKQIGSLMRLQAVIKRYAGGQSDIIVQCEDLFFLHHLTQTFGSKLYPGGEVALWDVKEEFGSTEEFQTLFREFLRLKKNDDFPAPYSLYKVANELNLGMQDRYKLLTSGPEKFESILINHLKFDIHLLRQEEKSRDFFHLN